MKYLILLVLTVFPAIVNASHTCTGKVINVDVSGAAVIHANIDGVGDGNMICALNRSLGKFEPEACKAALSMLMAAKVSGKKVRLYFKNDTNTSCSKGHWQDLTSSAHELYYIRLEG